MASKLDDLLNNVVNKLKATGIGQKRMYQRLQESDPYLKYISPGGGMVRGEPMTPEILWWRNWRNAQQAGKEFPDWSNDVYYDIKPRANIVQANYPTYTPDTANIMQGGLLSTPQGLDTVPKSRFNEEASAEYATADQTLSGQIETKPEYEKISKPSLENPRNREFTHPITGIQYVIDTQGRTFEKDRVTQLDEGTYLMTGVSVVPEAAGNPFTYVIDKVKKSLGTGVPVKRDVLPTDRPTVNVPSGLATQTYIDPRAELPTSLDQTIDNLTRMRTDGSVGTIPVRPDRMPQQQQIPLSRRLFSDAIIPSTPEPIIGGTDIIPVSPERGDFRNMSIEDIRARMGNPNIDVNDRGDLIQYELNEYGEPISESILIEGYAGYTPTGQGYGGNLESYLDSLDIQLFDR